MAKNAWISLGDAVKALRGELIGAMTAAEGESLRFEVGSVEMEFAMTVRREGGGSAGVQLGVVSISGESSISRDAIHRVTVRLAAKDLRSGRPPEIASVRQPSDSGIPDR
jgi:hypothetical protein